MEYIRAAPNKAKTNLRYLHRQAKRVVQIQAEMFVQPALVAAVHGAESYQPTILACLAAAERTVKLREGWSTHRKPPDRVC
jgi:hypothetical protein